MGQRTWPAYRQSMVAANALAHTLTTQVKIPLPLWMELVDRWLENRKLSANTRTAYRNDLLDWFSWCEDEDLDPRILKFVHANAYGRMLESRPGRYGRPLKASSIARRLHAISSFYDYLIILEAVARNPVAGADIPYVDRLAVSTATFDKTQAMAMRGAAYDDPYLGECAFPLAALMVTLGARVSEVINIQLKDITFNGSYHVVRLYMKGSRYRDRKVPGSVWSAIEKYLNGRIEGPLFLNKRNEPLTRQQVRRFVQRIARKAGLPHAEKITPHSFRYAFNTIAKDSGVSIEDRQQQLGHAHISTTLLYDKREQQLHNDASALIDALTDPR